MSTHSHAFVGFIRDQAFYCGQFCAEEPSVEAAAANLHAYLKGLLRWKRQNLINPMNRVIKAAK